MTDNPPAGGSAPPRPIDYAAVSVPPPRRTLRQAVSRGMVRLTRPMPLGFYILLGFVIPIVLKLLLIVVAVVVASLR